MTDIEIKKRPRGRPRLNPLVPTRRAKHLRKMLGMDFVCVDAATLEARLAERERLIETDTRSETDLFLGVPHPARSALAEWLRRNAPKN